MAQRATLHHQQQVADAARIGLERHDLLEHLVRRAAEPYEMPVKSAMMNATAPITGGSIDPPVDDVASIVENVFPTVKGYFGRAH